MTIRLCTVQGCDRATRTRSADLCEKHYTRWKRHGDPMVVLKDHTPPEQRWRTSYTVNARGCWVWSGPVSNHGYGIISCGAGNQRSAHRFVWEQHNGPVPDGLELDHLCRNTVCVNPLHMEAVTHLVSVRRGNAGIKTASKTHCDHGHEFTPENTHLRRDNGYRQCRACMRRNARAAQQRARDRHRARQREAGA